MPLPLGNLLGNQKLAWLHGYTEAGKPVVFGPFKNDGEAWGRAGNLEKPQVFLLPTRDQGKATRMIRAKLIGQNGVNYDDVLQRMSHKPQALHDDGQDNRPSGLSRFFGKRDKHSPEDQLEFDDDDDD